MKKECAKFGIVFLMLIAVVSLMGSLVVAYCIDTDNSTYPTINHNLKGTATMGINSSTDFCSGGSSGGRLYEYYCNSLNATTISYTSYICPVNCLNGACKNQTTISGCGEGICQGGIEKNVFENQTLNFIFNNKTYLVRIVFLSSVQVKVNLVVNGATLPSLTRGDSYKLSNGEIIHIKYIGGGDADNSTAMITFILGETVESCPKDCNETKICIDGDGGYNYSVKGIVTYDNQSYEDYCITNGTLHENACSPAGFPSVQHGVGCPYGCQNGACIKAPACSDSDGGRNYVLKGTCASGMSNISYTDICKTTRYLKEYACSGNICSSSDYLCSKSCSNGACTNQTIVSLRESSSGFWRSIIGWVMRLFS